MAFSYETLNEEGAAFYQEHLKTQAAAFWAWKDNGTTRSKMALDKAFRLFWSMKRRANAFATYDDESRYKQELFTVIKNGDSDVQ